MNRYGDTPVGMVESALEFARIARKHEFHNFKFSMKSSNQGDDRVLSLLVARLEQEGPDWNYRSTSESPKRAKARTAGSRALRHRLAARRTGWGIPSGFR